MWVVEWDLVWGTWQAVNKINENISFNENGFRTTKTRLILTAAVGADEGADDGAEVGFGVGDLVGYIKS